ncbi:uncharacterized protein PRCAT00003742001 [Priceomyces carsonii]|uniref:uncharacterized protein n=1 Tax=Priceomyces carsonii TaxID=28549 RepID=UPI002ED97543|nr:unnamed protein product [Priceomyces carsonii]
MLGEVFSNLFGASGALSNEPTIDYNQTIQSFPSNDYESTIDTRFDNDASRRLQRTGIMRDSVDPKPYDSFTNATSGGNFTNLFSGVIDDESDEEINNDISSILDNLTKTTRKFSERDEYSLPQDYPGKFRPVTPKERNSSADINRQIREIETELENEQKRTVVNSRRMETYSQQRHLRDLVEKVEKQNAFLYHLNELVDISATEEVPSNISQKYSELKEEYIKELSNIKTFYEAYYKLVLKYRDLKKKKKPAPSLVSVKEKIRLIKSTSNQASIRSTCENILRELSDNENTAGYYKDELKKANERIKELEALLSSK